MTLKERIEYLEKEHGEYNFDGVGYVLIQLPYATNSNLGEPIYESQGIRKSATPDDMDTVDLYNITWEVIDHETDDACHACDWDNPSDVTHCSGYLYKEDRVV